jgi:tRNA (Thr-GGU) A37 N-methylase
VNDPTYRLRPVGWVESPLTDRSPDRPNPIGLHAVTIVSVERDAIAVSNLDAIHGTPVVDVKPVLGRVGER